MRCVVLEGSLECVVRCVLLEGSSLECVVRCIHKCSVERLFRMCSEMCSVRMLFIVLSKMCSFRIEGLPDLDQRHITRSKRTPSTCVELQTRTYQVISCRVMPGIAFM